MTDIDPEEWIRLEAEKLSAARAGLGDAVRHARAEHDWSWADVGRVLGVSKQAAQERFGRVPEVVVKVETPQGVDMHADVSNVAQDGAVPSAPVARRRRPAQVAEPTICPGCARGDHPACVVRTINTLSWRCDCTCTPLTWSRTEDADHVGPRP